MAISDDKLFYGHVTYYDPDKGYGQIEGNDGEVVFLHKSEMIDGCLCLFKWQQVAYGKKIEGKRRPRAVNVKPLG